MKHVRSTLVAIAAIALSAPLAQAADLLVYGGPQPIYNGGGQLMNFEGFYVGATGGISSNPSTNTTGAVGVVAGTNFAVTDGILAGAEVQGEALIDGSGVTGVNGLLLGRVGGFISDNTMIYGAAGAGWVGGTPSYAFGGGIEAAVADPVSVRGEILGTGTWGGAPDGAKATAGVIWHLN